MPVTVVFTSFATVAIETFITDVSSVIRNWPAASVSRMTDAPLAFADAGAAAVALTREPGRPRREPARAPGPAASGASRAGRRLLRPPRRAPRPAAAGAP